MTLLNSLNALKSLPVDFFGFPLYITMSSANNDSFHFQLFKPYALNLLFWLGSVVQCQT